jgi:hypothetical protein
MIGRDGIRTLVLFLLVATLLVIGQVSGAKAQGVNQSDDGGGQLLQAADADPIGEVQGQIERVGAYGFTANVEQIIIPRAIAANIGKTEERVDWQLTGQVTLPDDATLTLRFEAGGVPPITLEQEGTDR